MTWVQIGKIQKLNGNLALGFQARCHKSIDYRGTNSRNKTVQLRFRFYPIVAGSLWLKDKEFVKCGQTEK